jgi:indole-3-glycerol phosphate synthase
MSVLHEIFAHKRQADLDGQRRALPLAQVRREAEAAPAALDFAAALQRPARKPALIAEVKRASPSRGLLARDFDPLRLAETYQQNGAAAISVLTEERHFQGSLEHLRQIAALPARPPLLRKDFIFDPYQVYEARAAGADAVLLIVAYLGDPLRRGCLEDLHTLILSLGMTPLVEVHNRDELELALACGPRLVGINNRDLTDFSVRLETTLELRPLAPPVVCLVAESGIHTREDADRLAAAGVDAMLIGEALVTAPDVAEKVRSFTQ